MPASVTHLQSRRRSSVARITRSRYQQLPAPSRLTFYPNLTPTTYVGPEEEDVKQDQLANASSQPESSQSPALLFPPPSANVSGPKRKRQRPGRRISQGYIPRPANSFMLFRADFVRQKRVPDSVEAKHGTLSRIIGSVWRSLPAHERDEWEKRADKEKEEHKKQYPDYKFRPIHKKRVSSSRKPTPKSSKFPRRTRGHDDRFDDSDYEYVEAAPSSKRTRTRSSPPVTQVLSLDNAPPSTYTPGSFRFAFATLREERQEYITQCLVQGIQKRPVQSLLGPLNPEEEIPGDWLEDYVRRWDVEQSYLQVRATAEKEEEDEKEAAAAAASSSTFTHTNSQVKQELSTEFVPTRAQHPRLTRLRRSSSQPLPEEFAHHYHHHPYPHTYAHTTSGQVHVHGFPSYAGQFQPQQAYPAGYHSHSEHLHPNNGYDYPQAQEAYHYSNSDHVNANYASYDQGQVYTSYPDTSNTWGTSVTPLSQPLHPSVPHPSTVPQSYTIGSNEATPNIALPQLPTTLTSSFPSPIPSSTPSPATAPGPLSSYSMEPSYTNVGSQATNATTTTTNTEGVGYRYSPSGRGLPGRRASSAEPCLTSQYTSGAFTGYPDPSSAWSHPSQQFHVQGHSHGHIQSREGYEQQQQVEERDAVEEMEELEFDPSAVQGWNPNFSFGITQTSVTSQGIDSSTPSGINSTGTSTGNAVHPHIYSSSSYIGSAGSVPYSQSPTPLNLDMSCTSQSPLDPLNSGPSPISTVSVISAMSAISPSSPQSSSLQVHAPQPITPSSVQHFENATGTTMTSMTMNEDEDIHMEVEEDTPTPPQAPVKDTRLQVGRGEERVNAAQVFTDLWKGLSSSQSFYMGRLGSTPGYPGDAMAMESGAEFNPAGQNNAYGEGY